MADITSLRSRLGALKIDAVFPGDADYSKFAAAYNQRFSYSPAAVVFPRDTEAVASAVKVAKDENLTVASRSGGHSYAAYGLGGANHVFVIDLKLINSVAVDKSTGQATIGAGVRIGDMAISLNNQGGRALPHGSCAYVGLGGHVAFGGFGYASREWGLTLDNVLSHEVVLGNGTIVTASKSTNPDLFWALRGAGASYGIMTRILFQTHKAPDELITYEFKWDLDEEDFTDALIKYQILCMSNPPPELGMYATLGRGMRAGSTSLIVEGRWHGDRSTFDDVFKDFLGRMPSPDSTAINPTNWIQSLQAGAGIRALSSQGFDLTSEHDTFYAKSLTTPASTPMTNASFRAFSQYLAHQGHQTKTNWFVQLEFYGGERSAVTAVRADETAFAQRSILLTLQLYASSSTYAPPFPQEGFGFVDDMVTAILANNPPDWQYGAYANYVDDRLPPSAWKALYYKTHYQQLEKIKAKYDPDNIFRYPQSITEPTTADGAASKNSP